MNQFIFIPVLPICLLVPEDKIAWDEVMVDINQTH